MISDKEKLLIFGGVIAAAVILILFFVLGGTSGLSGKSGERTARELENLDVPRVGEKAPEEGVGAPSKIAEGEKGKPGQEYWVFETELRDEKLNPFEFRLPVGDILGISIANREDKEHIVYITTASSFSPSFIERTIAPNGTEAMITHVLEVGEYDVLCKTCKTQVVGRFVVVPK